MSKYGKIVVDLRAAGYDSNKVQAIADRMKVGYDTAESVIKEMLYRKMYTAKRNMDPAVKAKRKAVNRKKASLRKALRAALYPVGQMMNGEGFHSFPIRLVGGEDEVGLSFESQIK